MLTPIYRLYIKKYLNHTRDVGGGGGGGGVSNMITIGGYITLGRHSGVSVRRASGQDSCSEKPRRLAAPQLMKWRGRVVPPGTITVLLQDIPREKGSLPIKYPDIIRPMY